MEVWKRFLASIGKQGQLFVVGPLCKHIFHPTGPTVFVDGGANAKPVGTESAEIPTITVGDGDSSKNKIDVLLPKEKDYSDLAFVLRTLPTTIKHVELIGFLGGRRDHELINYGEVHAFLKTRKDFTSVRFDEEIVAFAGGRLKLEISGEFSLVVLEESSVTVTGACKYNLDRPTKIAAASSHGLSNIGNGLVVFESSKPCFLFLG